MPSTEVRVFQVLDETCPVLDWLDGLEATEPEAYDKCLGRIILLQTEGNQLRRPVADMLRNGIRELRTKVRRVHYRILYSFYGSHVAVLLHGLTKEDVIEDRDIDLAIYRMQLVQRDPN